MVTPFRASVFCFVRFTSIRRVKGVKSSTALMLSTGSDKNLGLQKKRETPTVKANESLLNHRRRPLSCKYKYRSPSRLGQAQAYPRWNNVFKKQVNRRCERH